MWRKSASPRGSYLRQELRKQRRGVSLTFPFTNSERILDQGGDVKKMASETSRPPLPDHRRDSRQLLHVVEIYFWTFVRNKNKGEGDEELRGVRSENSVAGEHGGSAII